MRAKVKEGKEREMAYRPDMDNKNDLQLRLKNAQEARILALV